MATPARVTYSLMRLCDLERNTGTLADVLTEREKREEIARLRSILPAFILGHHDRKLQQGKRSIVPVINGVCSACHLRLPSGHVSGLQSSQDLEVCDNCGTFIYMEAVLETPITAVSEKAAKPAGATKRKASQRPARKTAKRD